MKAIDRAIAAIAPRYAVKRAQARHVLAAYEAAQPSKRHKKSKDNSTGERQVVRDAATTRAIARDLERNHDLVRGALTYLPRVIVGPTGISIEPTPRTGMNPGDADYDDIDDTFARQVLNLWREWTRNPEVTRTLDWVQVQELACRSWLRDGEVFVQLVEGNGAFIKHGSAVPLSIELLWCRYSTRGKTPPSTPASSATPGASRPRTTSTRPTPAMAASTPPAT